MKVSNFSKKVVFHTILQVSVIVKEWNSMEQLEQNTDPFLFRWIILSIPLSATNYRSYRWKSWQKCHDRIIEKIHCRCVCTDLEVLWKFTTLEYYCDIQYVIASPRTFVFTINYVFLFDSYPIIYRCIHFRRLSLFTWWLTQTANYTYCSNAFRVWFFNNRSQYGRFEQIFVSWSEKLMRR